MLLAVLVLLAGTAVAPVAMAQDARNVLQAASTAMGATNLRSIQYSGTGWNGIVGQNFGINDDWPRVEVKSYTRTIDYDSRSSKEEMVRIQGNYPLRGGGAGFPFQGEVRTFFLVSGNSAWNLNPQNNQPVPQPAAAEVRQLEIWLTPHGFLKAALASDNARVFTQRQGDQDVNVVSFTALGKYRVNGTINNQNFVQYVQTWINNPVVGDLLWETRYENYKDVGGGVKFPGRIHQHQADTIDSWNTRGHNSMEVMVSSVQPNVSGAALTVPDAVRTASAPPVRVESTKLADGVWFLAGGSHNSLAVEFRDYITIVEAPLNEARSLAVIEEAKKLIPNKPIRYVVMTHHHFDHSGGLRTYVVEGATILAREETRPFLNRTLFSPRPRILEPDRLSMAPREPRIETFGEKYVVSDGTRTLELHPVQGLNHANTMLIVYFPKERIVVNADLYSPPAQGAQPPAQPSANSIVLYNNIKRLKLDAAQIAPIHGRVGAMDEFERLVGPAANQARQGG
jgi:glyoxylase-like metal-dependent hydrolase (beta-lactamase superfamily II)